jgi:recombination protein RecR
VGKKSASRIAYYLLRADGKYAQALGSQILELQSKIVSCSMCGCYTESDPCDICGNPSRDRSVICVVEESQDMLTIEATREYNGLFHVLGGVISPIDGIGPKDLHISRLVQRINAGGVKEIILATNPTVEGDTTAIYLVNLLKDRGVKTSRLASGLPVGGDLEYADRLTLARSLKGRTPFSQ